MSKISVKGNNFLTRVISGACFVAIIVGFFLLSRFVDIRLFSILLWFVSIVGTFEVARALKSRSNTIIYFTQLAFGFLLIPSYYFFSLFFTVRESILFSTAFIILGALIVVNENIFTSKLNSPMKEVLTNLVPLLYPSLLLYIMNLPIAMWNKNDAFIVLLMTFLVCPLCDTFAYLVGMTWQKIKKGQAKKLCPNLSPKKTVAGGIGGLIGAVIGALIVGIIFNATLKGYLILIAIGVVSGVACQVGDLFESLIKRKVGIKDMGKIMPGHGGIMDRFDGITFTGALIFLIFYILLKI